MRKPIGVVAVICPWNLPLLLTTWKVAPALACGDTVVVKPSEETPQTATLLGEVMNAVGVPAGVYNVVHGFGPDSAGELLTTHPRRRTRSPSPARRAPARRSCARPPTARGRCRSSSAARIPRSSSPTATSTAAVDGTLRSCFANCGQVCLGTERVYVERPIFDALRRRRCKAGAEALKPGRPEDPATSIGPLISAGAPEQGALLLRARRGGGRDASSPAAACPRCRPSSAEGAWIEPTIWTGLPESLAVVREEIFGPCCHVAPFDSEDEAIRLANDTAYGLAAAVWTTNLQRAHRVAGGSRRASSG